MFCERIDNDALRLLEVVSAAGDGAEVVIEATYGWYWAVDLLQDAGFSVHLAHPSGNDWGKRRVKNDERDARDLADLLRLGSPARRRGSHRRRCVRHESWSAIERSWCSCAVGLKAQVHAVMAKEGVLPGVTDMFGPKGQTAPRRDGTRRRVPGARRVAARPDRGLRPRGRDARTSASTNCCATTAATRRSRPSMVSVARSRAIFVTEIGDISRFRSPEALCSWAGLTPRHRESDTKVVRGKITKQGSKLVRWAALEAIVRYHGGPPLRDGFHRIAERRGTNKARIATARRLMTLVYYGLRDGEIRCLRSGPPREARTRPQATRKRHDSHHRWRRRRTD